MLRLNRDKPYAHVYGEPGCIFQQNGRYFRNDGNLSDVPANADLLNAAPEIAIATADGPPSIVHKFPAKADDVSALKAQMAIYGEEWVSVAHARKFLAGQA